MARKKKESKNTNKIEDKKILSIQQLIQPFIGNNDHNRLQMVSSHLSQAIWVKSCEPPRVQSIYNKEMVKYSNMITYAEEDMENFGRIKLMNEEFILLKGNDIIELYKIDNPILSSAFTAYHTFINDKKKIKKGDEILVQGNSTKEGNLQIGTNALVGYMVYGDNFEDSIIISESFAEKLTHVERDIISFVINENEYLLNIYGDDKEYKCFPDIGENINPNSRILCAKRMINKGWNTFVGLSRKSNDKINFNGGDDIYYAKGKVVDISVYSNLEEKEENEKSDFFKSIEIYMQKNKKDIEHFLNIVEPFIKMYKKKELKLGPNLQYYYNKFRKIDANNVLTLNDKKFNGLYVKITVEREVKADIGCKLSNTHGERITI